MLSAQCQRLHSTGGPHQYGALRWVQLAQIRMFMVCTAHGRHGEAWDWSAKHYEPWCSRTPIQHDIAHM